MAAALNALGCFCDFLRVCHFPVCPARAVQFAAICREGSTYKMYLAHLKSACEFLGKPTLWASGPRVQRAKVGLLKAGLLFKGPKHAVSGELIARVADVPGVWIPERFFVVFSWVFMLRACSEASPLRRASSDAEMDAFTPLPTGVDGVVGLSGQTLIVRLRSRKNALFGDIIKRSCSCLEKLGVSAHVPPALCPVHVLWPWVQTCCSPGDFLFGKRTTSVAAGWLRMALLARDAPHGDKFGLHVVQRGAARELVSTGATSPPSSRQEGGAARHSNRTST